jgi:membrane-bound lytic murein transglycosylase MltF
MRKSGKAPTLKQRYLMQSEKMDPDDWLVVKNLPDRMECVNRYSGEQRTVTRQKRVRGKANERIRA